MEETMPQSTSRALGSSETSSDRKTLEETVQPNSTENGSGELPSHVNCDYHVLGMTSEICASKVAEELARLEHVMSVTISVSPAGASLVTVSSTSALDVHDVRAAVEDAGYDLITPASQ